MPVYFAITNDSSIEENALLHYFYDFASLSACMAQPKFADSILRMGTIRPRDTKIVETTGHECFKWKEPRFISSYSFDPHEYFDDRKYKDAWFHYNIILHGGTIGDVMSSIKHEKDEGSRLLHKFFYEFGDKSIYNNDLSAERWIRMADIHNCGWRQNIMAAFERVM